MIIPMPETNARAELLRIAGADVAMHYFQAGPNSLRGMLKVHANGWKN